MLSRQHSCSCLAFGSIMNPWFSWLGSGMWKILDHITQSLATTHDNFASEIGSQHIMDCPYARKAVHVFQTDLPPCLIHYLYGLIESYFWISVKGPEFTKQNKMERIRYPVLFFYAIHYFITSYLKENKHFCKQIQSDSKPNNDF